MRKALLWPIIPVFAVVSVPIAAQVPDEILFSTKMGEVRFAHDAHLQSLDCATCHHTGENVVCRSCHGQDADLPRLADALHTQCKGCHKEHGVPTGCRDCHRK